MPVYDKDGNVLDQNENQGSEGTKDEKDPTGSAAGGNEDKGSNLTLDQAVKEIEKLRREAASKRVRNRELDSELKEFNKWKESQMTEAERLAKERDALHEELAVERRERLAAKYNVPAERQEFITGKTMEDLERAAKALGVEKKPGATGPNLFPGKNGSPVGSGTKTDFDEILRQKLRA